MVTFVVAGLPTLFIVIAAMFFVLGAVNIGVVSAKIARARGTGVDDTP